MKRVDAIGAAFDRGISAAKADAPRSSNPYMPETESEEWQSWNCGYDEAEPRYIVPLRTFRMSVAIEELRGDGGTKV